MVCNRDTKLLTDFSIETRTFTAIESHKTYKVQLFFRPANRSNERPACPLDRFVECE